MPKFLLNLTNEQFRSLKGLSQSTGSPVAHLVRQAIDDLLDRQAPCSVIASGFIASGFVLVMSAR